MDTMLELNLSFSQDTFQSDERVEGRVTLRNAGDAPTVVNTRLALNSPYAPVPYRDLALSVSGPGGEALPFMARINVGDPADKHFRLLQPGESVSGTYPISEYYELQQPGTYQVQATYQNQAEPSRLNGHPVWTGAVQSNTATFTLKA